MNTAPFDPNTTSPDLARRAMQAVQWQHSAPQSADSGWLPSPDAEEKLFAKLKQAYHAVGGLVSLDQVGAVAERRALGDRRTILKLVESRRIFSLRTQDNLWIPVFQLERETMHPKEHVRRVVVELRPAFDDWGIAQWFVENNAWLRYRTPLAMINRDLGEVMNAARADCFVAGA